MRDHTKLRAFELADELALCIYQLTRPFSREEQFGLAAQMRRAAVSIASNIAEGCARQSEVEYCRFLDIAFGSGRELEYQVTLATRLGFMIHQASESALALARKKIKVHGRLIRSVRK
jgi:four helix bundle protein